MLKLITAALIGVLAGPAFGQAVNTAQSEVSGPAPIFRMTVVGRTTAAINYRPRSGETTVELIGTVLMPNAHGVATVSGKKGHFEIDARLERIPPATRFGSEYLTYVLWAITPEGRPKNLGELQIQGDTTRTEVTTELQAFALVVTAEPYFAVTQPSDVVVMENAVRESTQGTVQTLEAKYELLQRGGYLMDQRAAFTAISLEGAPLDLAEARNAVALARIAGADRYAADSFARAARLLADAEAAHQTRTRSHDVMMSARQAAQTAEDARLIALKRREEALTMQQREAASQREREALEQRRRAEVDSQTAALAKAEIERERVDVERARQDALKAREDAQQARLQVLKAEAAVAVAEQEKHALRERLREQLNAFLDTRETARGLIMNVPDVLFDSGSVRLTAVAREKLARVSGILGSHPDLHIAVEGHTDTVGSAEQNQRLSERRAASVLAYLVQQKIPLTAVDIVGFGETRAVASNDSPEGRQQNRRVELVVSGESIGRSNTGDAAQ